MEKHLMHRIKLTASSSQKTRFQHLERKIDIHLAAVLHQKRHHLSASKSHSDRPGAGRLLALKRLTSMPTEEIVIGNWAWFCKSPEFIQPQSRDIKLEQTWFHYVKAGYPPPLSLGFFIAFPVTIMKQAATLRQQQHLFFCISRHRQDDRL